MNYAIRIIIIANFYHKGETYICTYCTLLLSYFLHRSLYTAVNQTTTGHELIVLSMIWKIRQIKRIKKCNTWKLYTVACPLPLPPLYYHTCWNQSFFYLFSCIFNCSVYYSRYLLLIRHHLFLGPVLSASVFYNSNSIYNTIIPNIIPNINTNINTNTNISSTTSTSTTSTSTT